MIGNNDFDSEKGASAGGAREVATDAHRCYEAQPSRSADHALLSAAVFLGLCALTAMLAALQIRPVVLAALGIVSALSGGWFVWSVIPGGRRRVLADASVAARTRSQIATELGVKGVDVECRWSTVTLRGAVPFEDFIAVAEQLAVRQGARHVVNELIVLPRRRARAHQMPEGLTRVTAPPGGEAARRLPLERAVRQALDADHRVRADLLDVRVEDGIAYIAGRQGSAESSEAAAEAAAHVPGIVGVANDIKVTPGA